MIIFIIKVGFSLIILWILLKIFGYLLEVFINKFLPWQ